MSVYIREPVRIPLSFLLRSTWKVAVGFGSLVLMWLEDGEGGRPKGVVNHRTERVVELQGPMRSGVKRAAKGVYFWRTTVASRSSLKGGRLQSLTRWKEVRSGPSLRTSTLKRAEGRDGKHSLTQTNRSPRTGRALACREANPWRC